MRVALGAGGELVSTSRVLNTDSKPFSFTFAYHTYFAVSDIRCATSHAVCPPIGKLLLLLLWQVVDPLASTW